MAVIAQEEPVAGGSWHEPVTPTSICVQGLGYALMKRHPPLPVEFGFPDTENADSSMVIGEPAVGELEFASVCTKGKADTPIEVDQWPANTLDKEAAPSRPLPNAWSRSSRPPYKALD